MCVCVCMCEYKHNYMCTHCIYTPGVYIYRHKYRARESDRETRTKRACTRKAHEQTCTQPYHIAKYAYINESVNDHSGKSSRAISLLYKPQKILEYHHMLRSYPLECTCNMALGYSEKIKERREISAGI